MPRPNLPHALMDHRGRRRLTNGKSLAITLPADVINGYLGVKGWHLR